VDKLSLADKWILTRYQDAVRGVTENLENYDLGLAATKLYDFVWSTFCDWYIEMAKQGLYAEEGDVKETTQEVLLYVLTGMLKLLHPYMPFITEEVYSYLPKAVLPEAKLSAHGAEGMLIKAAWPEVKPEYDFPEEAARMEGIMDVIRAVRNLRAEMNVQPGRKATLILKPHAGWADALKSAEGFFKRLANASGIELLDARAVNPDKSASAVAEPCELFMPLGELVDVEKELKRLAKDLKGLQGEIARAVKMLANPGFLGKAPAQLVENEKEKLATNRGLLEKLMARIAEMESLR